MNWIVFWVVFICITIVITDILTSASFWKLVGIIFLIWVLVHIFNWLFTPDVPVYHDASELIFTIKEIL